MMSPVRSAWPAWDVFGSMDVESGMVLRPVCVPVARPDLERPFFLSCLIFCVSILLFPPSIFTSLIAQEGDTFNRFAAIQRSSVASIPLVVMAFASLTPVASFPILFRVRDNIQPLAFPVSTSLSHLDSSTRFHGFAHLPMRNHSSKLAEPEAVKWRNRVSFFPSFLKKKSREDLKQELFEAIASLDRGAETSPEDQERVEQIARELEAINPVKEPLKSDFLNGKWELLYTTSKSILQPQRPKFLRPFGKIYQAINADTLRAQNMETWPFFNQVTANLVPINSKRVAVKFDTFKIGGLLPFKAPGSGRGELEITYLDEEIRISRGDKGNLFVLKMVDPSYRVPT
ncbi:hypothetical protein HPP92_010869 [Vanilla planifolia]|uniref:Plastid lipid-associated protein/fibrillin conserved domain-containing protein n=1 Tax=Vanilla planifolia TaxID=51239 RepID=A0A835V3W9_VANPL|nr:hypothetical protein HPP92_010869 [Vanilla planifolia]